MSLLFIKIGLYSKLSTDRYSQIIRKIICQIIGISIESDSDPFYPHSNLYFYKSKYIIVTWKNKLIKEKSDWVFKKWQSKQPSWLFLTYIKPLIIRMRLEEKFNGKRSSVIVKFINKYWEDFNNIYKCIWFLFLHTNQFDVLTNKKMQ